MAKKLHGGHSKNAILAFDDQSGVAEPMEENPEVLDMVLLWLAGDDDVIQVYEDKVQPTEHRIHVPLEGVACVSEAKGCPQKLPQPEWRDDAVFGMLAACMRIRWYPILKSTLEKTTQPSYLSAKSALLGSG